MDVAVEDTATFSFRTKSAVQLTGAFSRDIEALQYLKAKHFHHQPTQLGPGYASQALFLLAGICPFMRMMASIHLGCIYGWLWTVKREQSFARAHSSFGRSRKLVLPC